MQLLKITYLHQTHLKNLKQHQTFDDVLRHIALTFKKLPKFYRLVYEDDDKDLINLDNQDDLEVMRESLPNKVNIIIKETEEQVKEEVKDEVSENKDLVKVQVQPKSEQKQEAKVEIVQDQPLPDEQKPKIDIKPSEVEIADSQSLKKNSDEIKVAIEPSEAEKKEKDKKIVHDGIKCDKCGVYPIVGIRYKCSICPNYDFCQKCQQTNQHEHAVLKIKNEEQQYYHPESVGVVKLLWKNGFNKVKSGLTSVTNFFTKKNNEIKQEEPKPEQKLQQIVYKVKQEMKPKRKPRIYKNKQVELQDQQINTASMLSEFLGIDFNTAFTFVRRYPNLDRHQLIVHFFEKGYKI